MPVHYTTLLDSGKHWSLRLRRGLCLEMEDLSGTANVAMVFYNAHNLLERYNAPDTLKCQHTFHLTQGHCLYSDMGRIFASITHDTIGAHETICGNSDAQAVEKQFGRRNYQQDRNAWHQNGHDAFLVELEKYGLDRADLPSNINWFSHCAIQDNGDIALADPAPVAGNAKEQCVRLRIEMDCIVVLHTCPHPMLKSEHYPDMQVSISLMDSPPLQADDECMNQCDENRRGFENNRLYHLGFA